MMVHEREKPFLGGSDIDHLVVLYCFDLFCGLFLGCTQKKGTGRNHQEASMTIMDDNEERASINSFAGLEERLQEEQAWASTQSRLARSAPVLCSSNH